MPFPSTRVIHPRFAEHHAPVSEGAMNASCTITFGGTAGDWQPGVGATPGTSPTTYTGPCRVQYASTVPRNADAADQTTTERTVLVVLPRGSAKQSAGARVTITAVDANGPAALVDRVLSVGAVGFSSIAFEQDLACTDDQANQAAGV